MAHPEETSNIKPAQTAGGKAIDDDEDDDVGDDVDDIDADLDGDGDGDGDAEDDAEDIDADADADVDVDTDEPEEPKEYEDIAGFQAEDPDEDPCDIDLLTEMDTTSHIVQSSSSIRTTLYLTKYEKSRVLGLRSQQIRSGAPPMIHEDALDPAGKPIFRGGKYPVESYDIALKELEYGMCPIIIGRRLPNGEKIMVSVSSLIYVA